MKTDPPTSDIPPPFDGADGDAKRRQSIAEAKAQVQRVAGEIAKASCDDDEAFKLMWSLAWVDLRNLEEFRDGQAH